MNWIEIEPQSNHLIAELKTLMSRITELNASDCRYPAVTDNFKQAQNCIEHPSYNIVVCGEMKKGKSSLLNAIIGHDILPVANQVATSQVFRISNNQTQSFELVFSDGSRKSISKDQLAEYGSQVEANLYGSHEEEFNGKLLDYIQVNTPVEFLPDGVSLIDTPGLGAVYKSHESLTQNYVRKAAAVLFVFDPERPLVDLEQKFIKKVLEVTPHIMFVMTKIDMYKASEWSTQLERTKESLGKLFAQYNKPAPDVFPMSSVLLAEAAKEEEPDFREENVKTSMFPAVKDELMRNICKAVGLTYTSRALYEAQAQIIKVRKVATELLQAASDEGKQLDQNLSNEKRQMQQRLESEWVKNSAKNHEVADEVSAICNNVVVNKVQQMFRSTGSIRAHYQDKIDGLGNMDEVKQLCEEMPRALVNDIASQWKSIMEDAQDRVSDLLNRQLATVDDMLYGGVSSGNIHIDLQKLSCSQKLNNYRNKFFEGAFVGTIASIVCPPLAPIIAIGAAIWGWITGDPKNKEDELKMNKANLRDNLSKMLDQMYSQLLDVQAGQTRSVVSEFVYQLKKTAEEIIANKINGQKQQMARQLEDLQRQAQKSIEEKRQEVGALSENLKAWNALVPKTKELADSFIQIESALTSE